MKEQDSKINQVIQVIQDTVGSNNANVTIAQRNINPYFSNQGAQPSNNVTFNVQSSVRINTDIDHLSDLVNKIAEAGFGFENVYINPSYPAAVLSSVRVGSGVGVVAAPQHITTNGAATTKGNNNQTAEEKNPIAIGVSINTKPNVLTKAIAEYEEKYRKLLDVLAEAGVSKDQIQQENFNIYPLFYGQGQNLGYNANTQILVNTDPKNIELLTKAVPRNVSNAVVQNIVMSVSDSAIDKARAELSQQAIANARARAEEIAKPLGFEVKEIRSIDALTSTNQFGGGVISYRGVNIIPPYYHQNTATGEITVSVTAEFEMDKIATSAG